jgi:glycosyltransferase involved in cell wall biosynthesis
MKVALIHDHLAQDGGAEKVLQVFTEIFPQAVIYTLLFEKKNVEENFKNFKIETSIIQKLPFGVKHYKWYLRLMPLAVEFFDLRKFDLVISDTSSFAKGVITSPEIPHICYCHTPTRYLWSDTHQYINELKYNKFFKKIISLSLSRLRLWDLSAASRVDYFIANSQAVKKRIVKYYKRDSSVIYPPVETDKFYINQSERKEEYFLAGCRLAPYKRIDLVIQTFLQLKDKKLKIFGSGIDLKRLKKLAKGASNIEFVGRVNQEQLAKLYSNSLAYIHPQEEDFGITAVEAMASGRPVIAYGYGGALETVIEKKTGLFFFKQDIGSLKKTILNYYNYNWDSRLIRAEALKFNKERFVKEIKEFILTKTKIKV